MGKEGVKKVRRRGEVCKIKEVRLHGKKLKPKGKKIARTKRDFVRRGVFEVSCALLPCHTLCGLTPLAVRYYKLGERRDWPVSSSEG